MFKEQTHSYDCDRITEDFLKNNPKLAEQVKAVEEKYGFKFADIRNTEKIDGLSPEKIDRINQAISELSKIVLDEKTQASYEKYSEQIDECSMTKKLSIPERPLFKNPTTR